jgi:hypothetical protein
VTSKCDLDLAGSGLGENNYRLEENFNKKQSKARSLYKLDKLQVCDDSYDLIHMTCEFVIVQKLFFLFK